MDEITFLENEIKSLLSLGEHQGIPIPWCFSDVDECLQSEDVCRKTQSLRALYDSVMSYLTSRDFPNRTEDPLVSISNLTEVDIEDLY